MAKPLYHIDIKFYSHATLVSYHLPFHLGPEDAHSVGRYNLWSGQLLLPQRHPSGPMVWVLISVRLLKGPRDVEFHKTSTIVIHIMTTNVSLCLPTIPLLDGKGLRKSSCPSLKLSFQRPDYLKYLSHSIKCTSVMLQPVIVELNLPHTYSVWDMLRVPATHSHIFSRKTWLDSCIRTCSCEKSENFETDCVPLTP